MKKKIVEKKAVSNNNVHPDPLLNRIYQNRGVNSPNELDYTLKNLISPWLMKDMALAAEVVIKHITNNSHIIIVGDYDCDGATSTTIAIEGLKMCGAKSVEFVIPDRVIHGYGLSDTLVKEIDNLKLNSKKPDLIITVDNGISSFDAAEAVYNMSHPCELVITDHHLANEKGILPRAEAVINPNRLDCTFPSKNIAGCGVMFYLIMAIRSMLDEKGYFKSAGISKPDLRCLLDVLTLGTVADVVTLDYNNRLIVQSGLARMNAGNLRPGMQALLDVAGRKIGELVASDMGFAVGPRINAAGRLSDMSIGIRCLLSRTYEEAYLIAQELDTLNRKRREVEQEMMDDTNEDPSFDPNLYGITVRGENWHEGVIGIVASRIKEKANRPVICLTKAEDHKGRGVLKGSARSVKGVHLKHILVEIEAVNPDIFIKFGGHAMAAGMSIYEDSYDEFSRLFNERVKANISQDILDGLTEVDILDMPEEFLTLNKGMAIEKSGPWGQNFEEPLFCATFDIISTRALKDKHLRLELQKGSTSITGIWFNCIDESYGQDPLSGRVKVVFSMSVNRFRGKESLQLMVRHLESEDEGRGEQDVPQISGAEHTVKINSLRDRPRDVDGAGDAFTSLNTTNIINQVLNG